MYRQARSRSGADDGPLPRAAEGARGDPGRPREGNGRRPGSRGAAFGELATEREARNLIGLFLATQRRGGCRRSDAAHGASDWASSARASWARASPKSAPSAGCAVRMRDVETEAVARGLARIATRWSTSGVKRRRFQRREGREISARHGDDRLLGLPARDLVIEAVFEDLAVKRNVIRELEGRPASRTRSSRRTRPRCRSATSPARPCIPSASSACTSSRRCTACRCSRSCGPRRPSRGGRDGGQRRRTHGQDGDRRPRHARLLHLARARLDDERGCRLLGEGARIEDVDRAMAAFGLPVGPLALSDEVGLDVARHVGETVGAAGDGCRSRTSSRAVKRGATGQARAGAASTYGARPRSRAVARIQRPSNGRRTGRVRADRRPRARECTTRTRQDASRSCSSTRRALPGRGRPALGGRRRPRRGLGPRLPAVPRRTLPLGRFLGVVLSRPCADSPTPRRALHAGRVARCRRRRFRYE